MFIEQQPTGVLPLERPWQAAWRTECLSGACKRQWQLLITFTTHVPQAKARLGRAGTRARGLRNQYKLHKDHS